MYMCLYACHSLFLYHYVLAHFSVLLLQVGWDYFRYSFPLVNLEPGLNSSIPVMVTVAWIGLSKVHCGHITVFPHNGFWHVHFRAAPPWSHTLYDKSFHFVFLYSLSLWPLSPPYRYFLLLLDFDENFQKLSAFLWKNEPSISRVIMLNIISLCLAFMS